MVKDRILNYELIGPKKTGWKDFGSVIIILSLIAMLISEKYDFITSASILSVAIVIGVYISKVNLPYANIVDVGIALIFIYETVSYLIRFSFLSTGLEYEQEVILVFLFYLLLRILLSNRQRWFLFTICLLVFIFTITFISHILFLYFDIQVTKIFVNDSSQFKAFFAPFNYFINDWSTILLCFLCFVFVAADFFKNINVILWLIMFVIVGILTTFSRGAYLSLFIALPALIYILKTHFHSRFSVINFLFVLLCAILILLPFTDSILKTCQIGATYSQVKSINGRYNLLNIGITQFSDHYFWGVGNGNFSLFASHYFESNNIPFTSRVTNSFVQSFCEKGLFGTLIWTLPIVALTHIWIKREIATYPVVAIATVISILSIRELTFSTFFESVEMKMMVILFITYLCFHYAPRRKLKFDNLTKFLVSFIVLTAIFVVAAISIRKQKADSFNNLIFSKGLLEEKLFYAQKAMQLFPLEGAYTNNLSIIYFQLYIEKSHRAYLDSAELYSKKAIAMTPLDYQLHNNLNWIYAYKGKTNFAISKMNSLVSKFPSNSLYLLGLAEMYKRIGKVNSSVYFYSKASRYSPAILKNLYDTEKALYDKVASEVVKNLSHYDNLDLVNNIDPIQMSKDAQLFLIMNNSVKAESILKKVNSFLPNLSRPYLFLALINLQNGNHAEMSDNFRRSIWLNDRDYLTIFYKNSLLRPKFNSTKSSGEKKSSSNQYKSMRSLHYEKAKKWYSSRTFKNDIIPQDFLYKLDYPLPESQ